MSNKVRVGIVGTSGWAEFMYLPALQSHPQAEIAAICGRNQGSVKDLAGKHHIPHIFTDYKEMIHRGGLDAILIGTPDDLHYEMTMQGLSAGLHVLCDKPLAVTAQQAWEMYQAAETAKVIHMVLFTYRWMPFFRYVKDLIDQGYVGRFYHAEFRYLMGYARQKEYLWRFDQKRANGALGDLGVHMIDMARWLVAIFHELAHSWEFLLTGRVLMVGELTQQTIQPSYWQNSLTERTAPSRPVLWHISQIVLCNSKSSYMVMRVHLRLMSRLEDRRQER